MKILHLNIAMEYFNDEILNFCFQIEQLKIIQNFTVFLFVNLLKHNKNAI